MVTSMTVMRGLVVIERGAKNVDVLSIRARPMHLETTAIGWGFAGG
jgi:hypothetical protein